MPATGSIKAIDCESIKWILVVEKDAIFRSLTSRSFWHTSLVGPGVLMTAKGYPDLLTCSFLQLVRFNCPQIPVFVLADYDPDGLNILRYYRLKSDIMSRERSPTAPDIRWLGIRSQDLLELETRLDQSATPLPIDLQPPNSQSSQQSASSRTSISSTECREPISPLSVRDRKLAVGMLDKLREARDDPDAIELQRELRVILMMSIKAEIQWLDEAGNLTEWLDVKLGQMLLES